MSAQECIDIVRRVAPNISDQDLEQVFEKIQGYRDRLTAEGKIDQLDRRLRQLAREEGQKAKIAAALQRKHAALNAIVRDRLERTIADHVASGLSYPRAVLAVLEGTAKGIASGRVSVSATRLAFESRFVGDMLATIQRERPHIERMLGDSTFADDIVREMFELRQGGKPGVTKNQDAQWMARTFATFAELSRTDLNRMGAAIGKLDGWAGPQVHDPHKLLGATESEWVQAILPRLDMDRTFGRDQARIDTLAAEHERVTADLEAADKSVRLLSQGLEAIDDRETLLAGRAEALQRRRAIADARLQERQGEYGATLQRLSGNRARLKAAAKALRNSNPKGKSSIAPRKIQFESRQVEFTDAWHERLFEYGLKLERGEIDAAARKELWEHFKGFVEDERDAPFNKAEHVDDLATVMVEQAREGDLGTKDAMVVDPDQQADYLMRNIERQVSARPELRDALRRSQPGRLKGAASENTVGLNRLRRKANQAHDVIDRIDGALAKIEAERKQLPDQRAEVEARRDAADKRRSSLRDQQKQLDLQRGDLRKAIDDPVEFLRQAYRTIVTGRDSTITAAQKGEFTGPANLARTLERHRVLHFKSADDWLAYNRQFGHGNVVTSMIAHQQRAARLASQMQILGPNPEVMLSGLMDSLQLRIRNDKRIPDAAKQGQIRALTTDGHGRIASALAEVRGLTLAPENLTAARIGSSIRAWQSMSKLMAAVVSSMSDVVTGAANLHFHGKPLFKSYADQLVESVKGRGQGFERELAYLIGEGYDGLIGHVLSPHVAGDSVPGVMSKAMEWGFRWSGLTRWTDAQRSAGARILSAYMGSKVDTAFSKLEARFRHGLSLHGITAERWDALRQAQYRAQNGNVYVTGDRIRDLPDHVIDTLIPAADIAEAKAHFKLGQATMKQFGREVPVPAQVMADRQAKFDGWLARRRDGERYDLELSVRRYFADEMNFAVIETDDQARRMLYWGLRPGSFWGEAARFIGQFKGYPIAFTNRVLGRAISGGQGGSLPARILNNSGHIGHLIVGLTIAGYLSMTAKDILRGWWPPRDPTDPKTILAALAQGGGGGIYGDFLFGQASRFGNGPLETVAGPTLGAASNLLNLAMHARDGDARAGDALNVFLQNVPLLNMWYARPALDFLILNSLHEAASPGYLARQERMRRKEMGQRRIFDVQ